MLRYSIRWARRRTPPIQKYLNTKQVPQLFVATGATKFNDPKNFPWTMGWQPTYWIESQNYASTSCRISRTPRSPCSTRTTTTARTTEGLKDGLGDKAAR